MPKQIGIREQVKKGLLTPIEALDRLRAGGKVSQRIELWLLRKAGRLPIPPPTKAHVSKKRKKDKHKRAWEDGSKG